MRRSTLQKRDRRTPRVLTGITLVMLALGMSAVGLAPAAAQDEGGTADDGAPLTIDGSALYVSPVTGALPPTLTQSVPPAALCVVAPDLCPETPEGLPSRGDVADGIGQVQDEGTDLPVQPVPPDSAAVSFLGGVTRYQTAIVFDAPAVPDGEDVMRYELTFPQSQPTYDASSPAFRSAILAVFETISSREPADLLDGLVAALNETPIDTSKILAFEACPLLAAFEPAGAPQASDVDTLPHHDEDGEQVPAVDCTFGGNGVYDEEADAWRLDLAFTAQAWADDEFDNHGVLLRPIGAPNLAFGDADTTTNAQLVLDLNEVTAVIETAEAFDPGDFDEFPTEDVAGSDAGADDGFDDEFEADAPDLGGGGDSFSAPLDTPDFPSSDVDDVPFAADAPEVAADLDAGQSPEVALDTQTARPASSNPVTPWWVWLVAPLLLGGAYLTGSAVLAPAPVVAPQGGGALTRMLAKHGAATTAPTQI